MAQVGASLSRSILEAIPEALRASRRNRPCDGLDENRHCCYPRRFGVSGASPCTPALSSWAVAYIAAQRHNLRRARCRQHECQPFALDADQRVYKAHPSAEGAILRRRQLAIRRAACPCRLQQPPLQHNDREDDGEWIIRDTDAAGESARS